MIGQIFPYLKQNKTCLKPDYNITNKFYRKRPMLIHMFNFQNQRTNPIILQACKRKMNVQMYQT